MLSPADYAAYSQATGRPYPQNEAEKASMYGDVRNFRANQLAKREEDSGPNILGIGAAVLGGAAALAGGGVLARGLMKGRGRDPRMQSGQQAGKSGVKFRENLGEMQQAVAQPDVQASADLTNIQNQRRRRERGGEITEVSDANKTVASNEFTNDIVETNQELGEAKDFLGFSKRAQTISNEAAEQQAQRLAQSKVDSLVGIQENREPVVRQQAVEAVDTGIDQLVMDNVADTQRQVEPGGQVEQINMEGGLTPRQRRMNVEMAPRTDLDSPEARNKRASYQFEQMDFSDGIPEAFAEQARELSDIPVRGSSDSAYALTGDPMDLPGVREMSPKEQRRVFGGDTPAERRANRSPGAFIESYFMSQRKDKGNALLEVADRLSAAASMDTSTPEGQNIKGLLLNPNVPTEEVRGVLGSTIGERRGRVGTNLTQELTEGARASMTTGGTGDQYTYGVRRVVDPKTGKVQENVPFFEKRGKASTDTEMGARMQQLDENVVLVDERNPFVAREMGQQFDPYGAEGLAGAEGIGTMVDTESFRERTNKGTTQIPGSVMEAQGDVAASERMERAVNEQLPVRRTEEGDPSRGYRVEGDRYVLEGTGQRKNNKIVSDDINVEGSKLRGNFEMAGPEPSATVTTQPVSRRRDPDEMLIRGDDGNLYVATDRIIEGSEPLMGKKAAKTTTGNMFLENTESTPISLSRDVLQDYAQDAQYDYFNNPSAKKKFLEENAPDVLKAGLAQGKTLDEIGSPSTRNDFVIKSVNDALMQNEGVQLDILGGFKADGEQRYDGRAHNFITDLLKTTKEINIYGRPAVLDAEGAPVKTRVRRGYTTYVEPVALEGENQPIPGAYKQQGSGGMDPMEFGDAAEARNVAFYNPRIQTAPQVVRDARTGDVVSASTSAMGPQRQIVTGERSENVTKEIVPTPLTERQGSAGTTGVKLAGLRQQMETAPQGLPTPYTSNVGGGLIANTKRPYSSYGYAAYGDVNQPVPQGNVAERPVNLPTTSPLGEASRVSGLEPQQRTIPGVTGYGARQRPSEADKAAQQLESYMSRLQRGRSTPLTSQAVIQPKLF